MNKEITVMSSNEELKGTIITSEQMNKFVSTAGDTLTGPLYGVTPEDDAVKELVTAEYVQNQVNELIESGFGGVPVGSVLYLSTTTTPNGYLLCDGTAVSRTVYSSLYAAIGDTYGNGDGTSTFNLPNLMAKYIQGGSTPGQSQDSAIVNIEKTSEYTGDGVKINFVVPEPLEEGEPSNVSTTAIPDTLVLVPYIKAYGTVVSEGEINFDNILDDITRIEEEQKKYILKDGNRGTISGYEVASEKTGTQTITIESPDTIYINTTGSVTLTFIAGDLVNVSTKIIYLTATGATTLTVQGCIWANGADAPTWGTSGKHLVLVASFIGGRVIVSVFDNDDI